MHVRDAAETHFSRARSRAMLSEIRNLMNAEKDKLLSFYDVKDMLRPKSQTYVGMRAVPVALIVGSEGRYRDFNRYFLPKADHLRGRWTRIDEARIREIALPAIQLYEIGGAYFVRDGNHRVSVAKTQGVEFIDAEVTSLSSQVSIAPGMTADQLRAALIAYEKRAFYESTNFGALTGDEALDFSALGRYDEIADHILGHKYFMNETREGEIPADEALVSWYKNVYSPTIEAIEKQWLLANFPGRTKSDLYVWIVKHWDFLKKKSRAYPLSDAAGDFADKYGRKEGRAFRLLSLLAARFFGRAGG